MIFRRKRPVGGAPHGDERDPPPLDFVLRDPLDDRPAAIAPAEKVAPAPSPPVIEPASVQARLSSPTTPSRQTAMPASPTNRPAAASGFKPLRPSDAVGRRDVAKPAEAEEKRRLIVGRDISLAGEITACDYLVVEGSIDAKLSDGRSVEIADGGLFRGTATVDEAVIGGRFEGELTVRGRLTVRGTGLVVGSIRYGELEVEGGGRLIGQLSVFETLKTEAPAVLVAPDSDSNGILSSDQDSSL